MNSNLRLALIFCIVHCTLTKKNLSFPGKSSLPSGQVMDLSVSCGVRNTPKRKLRIIGGKAAKKGDWPWQVREHSIFWFALNFK